MVDITAESGIDFRHFNGQTGRYEYLEVMGGGVVCFDFDQDGDLDLYFVNGNRIDGDPDPSITNRLYRNEGGMKFRDVTTAAGVGDSGYGQGAAAADYDHDGDLDLYVTNYGPNVFYRNNGDGTFTDVTDRPASAMTGWGQSVCFVDYDSDGRLDLYVQNYLQYGSTQGVESFIYVGSERVPDYPSPLGLSRDRRIGYFTTKEMADFRTGRKMRDWRRSQAKEWDWPVSTMTGIGKWTSSSPTIRWKTFCCATSETAVSKTWLMSRESPTTPRESRRHRWELTWPITTTTAIGITSSPVFHANSLHSIATTTAQFTDVSSLAGLAQATAGATGFDAHFWTSTTMVTSICSSRAAACG